MQDGEEGKDPGLAVSCFYFQRPGRKNTRKTLEIASRRAEELKVRRVLVPTTYGDSGVLALEYFPPERLVIVTHSTGFTKSDYQELRPENRRLIEEAGARILTCQHALGGVGRAVRKKLGTYELEEIIAYTLRIFGEGTKVAIEIALMAADAGLVSTRDPCVSLGGTGLGLDTALVLRPSHAQNFFDMRIMEVLAKPGFFPAERPRANAEE